MLWDNGAEQYYQKHDIPRLKKQGYFSISNDQIANMYLSRVRKDYSDAIMIVDGIGQTFVATERGKENLIRNYTQKLRELAKRAAEVEGFIGLLESRQFTTKR